MAKQTAAGTRLFISATAPATADETGYAALTYTEVGEITDFGAQGPVFAEITTTPVGDAIVTKFKGSRNNGSQNLTLDLDDEDAGQIVMDAALESYDDYYFKLQFQNGAIRYFPAKVMSFEVQIGSADNMVTASTTLGINHINGVGFVRVAAPA